jgi:hypothetical protein
MFAPVAASIEPSGGSVKALEHKERDGEAAATVKRPQLLICSRSGIMGAHRL